MTQEQTFMDFILVSSLLTLNWDWVFHLTFNSFQVTDLFLYSLIISENQRLNKAFLVFSSWYRGGQRHDRI